MKKYAYFVSACIALCVGPRYVPAQSPPAFDPKAMQAAMEAFDKVPDTVGTGKYPALKEESPALPNHVIYRPADLSKLGDAKLGVLAWGNGGCAADGAGARLHLAEIASHGYLAIANGKILSGPGAGPRPKMPPVEKLSRLWIMWYPSPCGLSHGWRNAVIRQMMKPSKTARMMMLEIFMVLLLTTC